MTFLFHIYAYVTSKYILRVYLAFYLLILVCNSYRIGLGSGESSIYNLHRTNMNMHIIYLQCNRLSRGILTAKSTLLRDSTRLYAGKALQTENKRSRRSKKSNDMGLDDDSIAIDRKEDGITLVIVESPAKSRTIQKFLPKSKYIVDYCAGHVRDFPTSSQCPKDLKRSMILENLKLTVGSMGIDVFNNFEPIYVNMESKQEIISRLKGLSKTVSRILLATDEDREGEAISWHLVEVLKPKVPFQRAVFHEITKSAIKESFNNPRDIDLRLVSSQEARKLLDRLVGYTMSPVLWRFVGAGLSAGRVQSCGLKLICDRERKRWDFKSSHYYSLKAHLADSCDEKSTQYQFLSRLHSINGRRIAGEKDFDGSTGELSTVSREKNVLLLNQNMTESIMIWLTNRHNLSNNVSYFVTNIDEKTISRRPSAPYITSTLQQDASRKLGLSPTATMRYAQELYEAGYITYMRTDSPILSNTAKTAIKSVVVDIFGEEYLDKEDHTNNSKNKAPKNAQEAHEAIRPAENNGKFKFPNELTNVEGKKKDLYVLIFQRTLASMMAPSQSLTTSYTITASYTQENEMIEKISKKKKSTKKSESGENATVDDDINLDTLHDAVFKAAETVVTFKGFTAVYDKDWDTSSNVYNYDPSSLPELSLGKFIRLNQQLYLTSGQSKQMAGKDVVSDDADESLEGQESDAKGLIVMDGIEAMEHVTRPPSRFTEASFIKELETIGVGRPSTYSKIFQILRDRSYVFVESHSLIPTIKGLIVSSLLEKHFPELVDPKFTAGLEKALDDISIGQLDKSKFLQNFYLGKQTTTEGLGNTAIDTVGHHIGSENDIFSMDEGLLQIVSKKIEDNAIDQRLSRCIQLPFLDDMGSIHYTKHGLYIDCNENKDTDIDSLESSSKKWRLPEEMEHDIRLVTKVSIKHLISTSVAVSGLSYGTISSDLIEGAGNVSLSMKSGKYGKYVEISDTETKSKKKSIKHAIPEWVNEDTPIDEIIQYAYLPKLICTYSNEQNDDTSPAKELKILLNCNKYGLYLSVEGYTVRYPVDHRSINSVTSTTVLQHIQDILLELEKERNLGLYEGRDILIRKSRFGYYLQCDQLVCGLGKLKPELITTEEAIHLLSTKGKILGGRKKKKRDRKEIVKTAQKLKNSKDPTTKTGRGKKPRKIDSNLIAMDITSEQSQSNDDASAESTTQPKRITGYTLYIKEMMNNGKSLGDVREAWKLDPEIQRQYKEKASSLK